MCYDCNKVLSVWSLRAVTVCATSYSNVTKVSILYSVYKLLPTEESLCKQTLPLKTNRRVCLQRLSSVEHYKEYLLWLHYCIATFL